MCGGSPLFLFLVFICLCFRCFFHVGEITQGSFNFNTLVLPSLNRSMCSFWLYRFVISCRGDSQGSRNYLTLVLPSLILLVGDVRILVVGEIHRVAFLSFNSRSPPMNRNTDFEVLWVFHLVMGPGAWQYIIGVADPLYCIYIV